MKLEVTYTVEEIIRYQVSRQFTGDGPAGWTMGTDCGVGDFKRKADAERVRDALEADAERRVRQSL